MAARTLARKAARKRSGTLQRPVRLAVALLLCRFHGGRGGVGGGGFLCLRYIRFCTEAEVLGLFAPPAATAKAKAAKNKKASPIKTEASVPAAAAPAPVKDAVVAASKKVAGASKAAAQAGKGKPRAVAAPDAAAGATVTVKNPPKSPVRTPGAGPTVVLAGAPPPTGGAVAAVAAAAPPASGAAAGDAAAPAGAAVNGTEERKAPSAAKLAKREVRVGPARTRVVELARAFMLDAPYRRVLHARRKQQQQMQLLSRLKRLQPRRLRRWRRRRRRLATMRAAPTDAQVAPGRRL